MSQIKTKCVFGPIPSRRLGRSLGIDLLPFKTCSMDCVYCECGATTVLTTRRAEYFPTAEALRELDAALASAGTIDYATFSGVGEPTLHSGIGEVIRHIRAAHPGIRICVLTNGSLFNDPAVRGEIAPADLVVPSLDASNASEFGIVNRPAPGLSFETLVSGLAAFGREAEGDVHLEIFIVPGVNDSEESAERFRVLAERIAPTLVQLNSLDRPGVLPWVVPAPDATLDRIAAVIGKSVRVEKIPKKSAAAPGRARIAEFELLVLDTIRSRPCTAADIAVATGLPEQEVARHLVALETRGFTVSEPGTRGIFYRPAPSGTPGRGDFGTEGGK